MSCFWLFYPLTFRLSPFFGTFCYMMEQTLHYHALPYPIIAFMSVVVFACVHLFASYLSRINTVLHGRFLSVGGGIAIAYVFIDLLPKLCEADIVVREAFMGFFPYFERHVYIMALCGFLLFFLVDRVQRTSWQQASFCLSLTSYALFNFLVGYAVTYKDDPDIQPLALFTFAMALHYFTNDYTLSMEHGASYNRFGRWILVASLFLGWITGLQIRISPAAIALVNAFIGGGVIMNVTRHELPGEESNSTTAFLLGALFYTVVLLAIG